MSKLLIDDYPLQVLPNLAIAIGLNEAIFIQQLHYWINGVSGKSRDGQRWIYNTYNDWQDNFPFWSNATIRRTIKNLEDGGYILSTSKYNAMKIDRTKWYTINYDKINEIEKTLVVDNRIAQNEQMDVCSLSKPITIDYTETKKEKEEGISSCEVNSQSNLPACEKPSDEVISIRRYFEKKYYIKYLTKYHRHKAEQNTYIDKRLQEIIDEYDEDTTKAFIDNYFKYDFNHNLMHFVEKGIIQNRMYEVAY